MAERRRLSRSGARDLTLGLVAMGLAAAVPGLSRAEGAAPREQSPAPGSPPRTALNLLSPDSRNPRPRWAAVRRTCERLGVLRGFDAADLPDSRLAAIERAAALVAKAAQGGEAVYGVNTGFGKLASVKIAPKDTAALQRNLILSHCSGVGEPVAEAVTRLMMALKILSLGRGASGVRPPVIALMEDMLAANVTPVVPAQGSVGASGDLAPLAHMTAVMIGEATPEAWQRLERLKRQ